MKTFTQYITEKANEDNKLRKAIVFDIWESPGKKVQELSSNNAYQKIECKYKEKTDFGEGIKISFLLGFKDGTWQLWMGKPGVVIYSDDSYTDLGTDVFYDAVNTAVDKCVEIIKMVKKEPNNWMQFYTPLY